LEIKKELSAEDLKDIIKKLNEHHDMLRSSFYIDSSNSISQKIKEIGETDCRLEVLDFSAFSGKDLADLIEKNCQTLKLQINLLEGDLTRFALIHTKEITFFFITIHHLIVDLVSWNIILEDLDLLMIQIQNQKKLKQ
jgi:hypothetical protein